MTIVVPAVAQEQPPQDPSDTLMREQMERERERLLERQTPELDIAVPEQARDVDPDTIDEPGHTFLIQKILQEGDSPLSESVFRRLVAPFENRQLGQQRIGVLLNHLNLSMAEAGYITSRAYVSNQSLASGVLTIVMVAGRVEGVIYNGQALADAPIGVRMALPLRPGDILQLRDIEQGVDQINRVATHQASIQIQPGEQPGGSIVLITNPPAERVAFYQLSIDNQGSPSTGTGRLRGTVNTANLLGLMDNLSLGFTGSTETNALIGSFSVPYGYNTFSLVSSWSEYQSLIGDVALVYGTSRSNALAWNRLFYRDRNTKAAFDLSLTSRQSQREINNVRLTPQTFTVVRGGVNRLTRFEFNGKPAQWSVDLGYSRGLDWLGADRDESDLPRDAARAQFNKLDLAATLRLPLLDTWQSRHNLSAQWSPDPLFSSEQIFAGGVHSVRGFADSAIGGDRGLVLRNELAWTQAPTLLNGRVWLEPFGFVDMGQVYTLADRQHQRIAGAGIGLRSSWSGGYLELVAGAPLHKPSHLDADSYRLNASLVLMF